jgi:hypothetical protein
MGALRNVAETIRRMSDTFAEALSSQAGGQLFSDPLARTSFIRFLTMPLLTPGMRVW